MSRNLASKHCQRSLLGVEDNALQVNSFELTTFETMKSFLRLSNFFYFSFIVITRQSEWFFLYNAEY
jgi:hypothetical protein